MLGVDLYFDTRYLILDTPYSIFEMYIVNINMYFLILAKR